MSTTVSGHYLYVDGTGNTLESIATDIADTAIAEWDSGNKILTIKSSSSSVYYYLYVRGTLTIGNPSDYTYEEELHFENGYNDKARLYSISGGHIKMYGKIVIDFFSGGYRSSYTYIYGSLTILGDGTNNPILKNMRHFYFFESQNNDTHNDLVHIENVTVGSAAYKNSSIFYLTYMGKVRNHIFKNIIHDKSIGKGFGGYLINISSSINGMSNIVLENLTIESGDYYPIQIYGSVPHFKNIHIKKTTYYPLIIRGQALNTAYKGKYDFDYNFGNKYGQQFAFIENLVIDAGGYYRGILSQGNGIFLLKDAVINTSSYSLNLNYRAIALIWGTYTYTYNNFNIGQNSMMNFVFGLTLTIVDKFNNPIENAIVIIEQSDEREAFTFKTKSNGKLENVHDLELAILTHQSKYGGGAITSNVEYWSDSSNSTFHKVTVYKEGFVPVTKNYVMDADKSDTIYLREISNKKIEV